MQIKKIALVAAAIGMAFSVASVSAAELANEFSGQMALGTTKTKGQGGSDSFGFGSVYYGRFFSPSFEGILGLSYSTSSVAGGGTSDTTGISVGGNYYFTPVGKAGNAAWYIGGDVGGSNTSGGGSSSSSTWSLGGGMKYFLTDTAAIDVRYMHREDKPSGGQTQQLDLLLVGASAFF